MKSRLSARSKERTPVKLLSVQSKTSPGPSGSISTDDSGISTSGGSEVLLAPPHHSLSSSMTSSAISGPPLPSTLTTGCSLQAEPHISHSRKSSQRKSKRKRQTTQWLQHLRSFLSLSPIGKGGSNLATAPSLPSGATTKDAVKDDEVDVNPTGCRSKLSTSQEENSPTHAAVRQEKTNMMKRHRSMMKGSRVLGRPLHEMCNEEGQLPDSLMSLLARLYEMRADPQSVFVFRLCPRKAASDEILRQLEASDDALSLTDIPIKTLAAALKAFLRSVPGGLLCTDYTELLTSVRRQQAPGPLVLRLLDNMATPNRRLMSVLLVVLHSLSLHSAVTLMDSQALASVLLPSLGFPVDELQSMPQATQEAILLTQFLIDEAKNLLGSDMFAAIEEDLHYMNSLATRKAALLGAPTEGSRSSNLRLSKVFSSVDNLNQDSLMDWKETQTNGLLCYPPTSASRRTTITLSPFTPAHGAGDESGLNTAACPRRTKSIWETSTGCAALPTEFQSQQTPHNAVSLSTSVSSGQAQMEWRPLQHHLNHQFHSGMSIASKGSHLLLNASDRDVSRNSLNNLLHLSTCSDDCEDNMHLKKCPHHRGTSSTRHDNNLTVNSPPALPTFQMAVTPPPPNNVPVESHNSLPLNETVGEKPANFTFETQLSPSETDEVGQHVMSSNQVHEGIVNNRDCVQHRQQETADASSTSTNGNRNSTAVKILIDAFENMAKTQQNASNDSSPTGEK